MKKNIFLIFYSFLSIAILMFFSCDKKSIMDSTPLREDYKNNAIIKAFNASPSTARNFLFIDGVRINTSAIAYNTAFPATAMLVTPGSRDFLIKDTSRTTTQPDLLFSKMVEAGKYYSIFTYDTVTAIKQIMVENDIVVPTDNSVRLRAAHFSFLRNATPAPIDIFSVKKNVNLFSNITYGQVSNYVNYTPQGADTLIVRQAGSTTNNLDTLLNFNPTLKRSYTLVFGGRFMTNQTTLARTLTSVIDY